jgi:signal peptidase II
MSRRAWFVFLAVLFFSLGLDQGSKAWARGNLPLDRAQPVVDGWWDWELVENPGAAFSSFQAGDARLLLEGLAVVAVAGIVAMAARTRRDQAVLRVGYALTAGGALGNLVDRFRDGAVTDFVRWRAHAHMWPVFNVADALLVIGVALIMVDGVVFSRRRAPAV